MGGRIGRWYCNLNVHGPRYISLSTRQHAFLILSEPTNDSTQFPATHNYTWFSQTRLDFCEQLQKTLHTQQAYLNDRMFSIVDGLYWVNWNTVISTTSSLQSDDMAEHSSMVRDLLLSNHSLFTADSMAVPTPFVELHQKKYGDGIYLEYYSEDSTLVNHHLSVLKDKFTQWLTPWEVNMA